MAVITKPSVRFGGFTWALCTILDTLLWCDAHPLPSQPADLVITAASDGKHKVGSRHYTFEAIDLRTKTFKDHQAKVGFASRLRNELGSGFTVLLESEGTPNEHLHIQKARKA